MNEITRIEWPAVVARATAELDRLRKKNDDVTLSPDATAAIRGQIRALKWLLDLPQQVALEAQIAPPGLTGGDEN